jgi:hypothetical protein
VTRPVTETLRGHLQAPGVDGSALHPWPGAVTRALLRVRDVLASGHSQPGARAEEVVLVNPLGAALHHYEAELESILIGQGRRVVRLSTLEPSAHGRPRALWLTSYLLLLARAALRVRVGHRGQVIVTWPVLGYWDLVLLRMTAGRRSSLVIHDPVPLVRSVGYGQVARRLASAAGAGVHVIVHSQEARDALDPRLRAADVALLPHPVLPPHPHLQRPAGTTAGDAMPRVRVLGQYKPERDLEALRRVAADLGDRAVLEVHGRGWPLLEGWDVHAGFVTEPELDQLIASSDAVLIPYSRFYQSGIAIRCLEQTTPVVGPRDTSLRVIFGESSPLLVGSAGDWCRAVDHAIEQGQDEAALAARRWRAGCEGAWREWEDANGNGERPAQVRRHDRAHRSDVRSRRLQPRPLRNRSLVGAAGQRLRSLRLTGAPPT